MICIMHMPQMLRKGKSPTSVGLGTHFGFASATCYQVIAIVKRYLAGRALRNALQAEYSSRKDVGDADVTYGSWVPWSSLVNKQQANSAVSD